MASPRPAGRGWRWLSAALLCVATALGAEPAFAEPDGFSLVGTWRWQRKDTRCGETYEFRADGSATVLSGDELTANRYEFDPVRLPNGRHRLVISVLQDLGGRDCADNSRDSTGDVYRNSVVVLDTDIILICLGEDEMFKCFGPLRRRTGR